MNLVSPINGEPNPQTPPERPGSVSGRDWTQRALALIVTLGFLGLLSFLAMRGVPADSKDVLNIMLGSLGAGWVSIVSYYFGSSLDKPPAAAPQKEAE